MVDTTLIAVTLAAYQLLLVGIGFWARGRTRNEEDFFLGGRGLGPLVAAISYSSSSSSAWTLLGLSGLAFTVGVSALWVVLGSILGMLVAWFWIAPRLLRHSREYAQITLTDFLAGTATGRVRSLLVVTVSVIVIFCFVFYVAAQFQGAGNTFSSTFELSMGSGVLLGAAVILAYTLLGGFWAVSVTDTVQGLLMAFTALALPLAALVEIGGPAAFAEGLRAVDTAGRLSWSGGAAGLAALGVVVGGLFVGIGTYGQPHLLVRFMALRDEQALRRARWISLAWFVVVFFGMYFLGLAGRILLAAVDNPETLFFTLTGQLFPPVMGAVMIAAVLSAIMSTADSQLLVAASAIAHDLRLGRGRPQAVLLLSRLTVALLVVLAVLVAVYLDETIFNRVLFAWIALGSAFGPTVFLRLAGVQLQPGAVLASILTGFVLAVALYLLPNTPGDVAERIVPFAAALLVLLMFRVGVAGH